MGAWEVQADPARPGNRLMRQVSPVWPACWGYSCSGPLTYFGPKKFNCSTGGFKMQLDVLIEETGDATFALSAGNTGISIDSATGAWNFTGTGSSVAQSGGSSFRKGAWHTLYVGINASHIVAALDGKLLGAGANQGRDMFFVQMGLDSYVYAGVDNWSIKTGDLMDF